MAVIGLSNERCSICQEIEEEGAFSFVFAPVNWMIVFVVASMNMASRVSQIGDQ